MVVLSEKKRCQAMIGGARDGPASKMSTSVEEDRLRIDSISSTDSGFDGLENIEPLELGDICCPYSEANHDSGNEIDNEPEHFPNVSLFSVAMSLRDKERGVPNSLVLQPKHRTRAAQNWMKALRLINRKKGRDPWNKFHLEKLPVERAIRHRYNAMKKTWKQDEVFVKMEKEKFDEGAMRVCHRMKKMDINCPEEEWVKDSNNYVAKRYKDESEVTRESYLEDIRLQMDAKLWGEEYNRHNPPKKVDIFMTTVYEFVEREGSPLFHVEHFIEGDYIKYNSNSGFVDGRQCRQTPQAFSHFTFECSGHELIVVDIQGVGDLYTDPQIHTIDGKGYGDGNLGTRGMALFFHSHSCNSICKRLGLSPFQLSSKEMQECSNGSSVQTSASETILRGKELALSPHGDEVSNHLLMFFSGRSFSSNRRLSELFEEESPFHSRRQSSSNEGDEDHGLGMGGKRTRVRTCSSNSVSLSGVRHRNRKGTENFSDSLDAESLMAFQMNYRNRKRATNVEDEMKRNLGYDDSVLGMVHLELAKYHELCRFTEDGTYDKDAALFHLKAAADCGIVSAIKNMAFIYCDLPHDILSETTKDDGPAKSVEESRKLGLEFMEKAAGAGDRAAMVYMARSYDTGLNLVSPYEKSLSKALYWYEEIQEYDELAAEDGREAEWGMDDPTYIILARQAEILSGEGEPEVEKNLTKAGDLYSAAAESAMGCMKGKLANKYFMLAEEVYGQMEDGEEE